MTSSIAATARTGERTYDFSPLWRSTIGFDRLFDLAETA
jgi:hypothetical protein